MASDELDVGVFGRCSTDPHTQSHQSPALESSKIWILNFVFKLFDNSKSTMARTAVLNRDTNETKVQVLLTHLQ